jgi:hypothetical protein
MDDDSLESQKPFASCEETRKKQYPNQNTTRGSVISVTSLNDRVVSSSNLLTTTAIFKKDLQYKLLFSKV